MSTNINHGFFTNLSMLQLLEGFKAFSPKVKQICNDTFKRSLLEASAFEWDKQQDNSDKGFWEIVIEKYKECENYLLTLPANQHSFSDIDLDLEVSCSVFPFSNNKTLILFYCEIPEVWEIWKQLSFIFDYHYQNSTDKPDNITRRQWKQREKDWDIALGGHGYGKPIYNSYSFTFNLRELPARYGSGFREMPIELFPSDKSRKKQILRDLKCSEYHNTIPEEEKTNSSLVSHMKFFKQFNSEYSAGNYATEIAGIQLKPIPYKYNTK